MANTIVELAPGKYGYQSIERESREPIERCWIWQLVNWRIEGMCGSSFDNAVGREARCSGGHVSCYLGNGAYFRAEMPQLGQTPAISITDAPVPRPKVRRGIETRWHDGRWEKLLRTGWTAA